MAVFCGPNEWEDATGYKWCSRFGSRDIADGCRRADINVGVLLGGDINNLNLGSFVDLVWYGIRYMANAQKPKITWEQFYAERCTPAVLTAAITATANAFTDAFGVADEDEEPDPQTPAPAVPGDSATSTNSPPAPA